MNGTGPTPMPGQLFQHGLSRGHFDGNDLVIVTDHFTFDPDGLDDHLHMASSVRKKITERYQLIDDTNLRVIITLEDPTFLTKPFKYAFMWTKRQGGLNPVWVTCDAETARGARWNTRTRATSTWKPGSKGQGREGVWRG